MKNIYQWTDYTAEQALPWWRAKTVKGCLLLTSTNIILHIISVTFPYMYIHEFLYVSPPQPGLVFTRRIFEHWIKKMFLCKRRWLIVLIMLMIMKTAWYCQCQWWWWSDQWGLSVGRSSTYFVITISSTSHLHHHYSDSPRLRPCIRAV